MQSLQINTGEIRLAINDDPERVIVLYPKDAIFTEKFYILLGNFKKSFSDFKNRAEIIESQNAEDEYGVPLNTEERLAFQKEVCQYARNEIDELIGAGTSQIVFGNALDIDAIMQFFTGIQPYMQKARAEKVAQYSSAYPKKGKNK